MLATLDFGNFRGINCADPASAQDVATRGFAQNAANLSTGTIPDARLSSNVALRNVTNTFTLQQVFPAGSAGAPSISFVSDLDTGIYSGAANQVDFVTGGFVRWSVISTGVLFASNGSIIYAGDGALASPAYSFASDTDTGVFRPTTNQLSLVTGGAHRLIADPTGLYSRVVNLGVAGTAGVPAYSFEGDTNTGMYLSGADSLSLTAGGQAVATFTAGVVALGSALGYTLDLGAVGQSNSATAGAATALPATPAGYASIAVGGVIKKFPFYNL